MDANDKLLCPSHGCTSGAKLIGIVEATGSVAFLGTPLPIDQHFVTIAAQGRSTGLRFRFANGCARDGCANWNGDCCGIAARISKAVSGDARALPNCGIRPQCRWYRERGERACAVCPQVVRGCEEGGAVPP